MEWVSECEKSATRETSFSLWSSRSASRDTREEIWNELFSTLLDTALMSSEEGFEQLHQHAETWGFLYKIRELLKKEELIKHYSDLQLALPVGSDADTEGAPLCDELISIQSFVKQLKILRH
jgi:hypothetical protein